MKTNYDLKTWLILAGILAMLMLVKAVTLGLTIAAGQIIAYTQGVGENMFLAAFFGLFTIVGAVAMGLYLKNFN